MKKLIILSSSIVLLAVLGYLTYSIVKGSGKSDKDLLDFSIADTSKVDKIIITDAF
jgi:hypothetical protein